MIKQNNAPRALGWTGFSLICGMALILLPLSATLAQVEKPQPAGLPPVEPAVENPPTATAAPAPRIDGDLAANLLETIDENPNTTAQREAVALQEELQKTSEEIQKLTARLRAAQSRLAELQRTRLNRMGALMGERMTTPPAIRPGNGVRITTAVPNATYGIAAPATNDQEQRLRTVEKKLDMLIEELRAMRPDRQNQPERNQSGLQRR